MVEIPKDLEKYLVKNEKVDRQYLLKHCTIFTSQHRVIITRNDSIVDIRYDAISGVELKIQRNWWLISIGLAILLVTTIARLFEPPDWVLNTPEGWLMYSYGFPWFYAIIGFIFWGLGYFLKSNVLLVKGQNQKQKLAGDKETLNTLYRILNERRFQTN